MSQKKQGQAWLAERLGVGQPRVNKLIKDGRITRKDEYTEEDAQEASEMLTEARTVNNATAGDYGSERDARVQLMIERTAKVKLEREVMAGGYISKDEANKDKIARVFSVRAKCQEIPLRASLIAHKTEAECERILSDWMRELCDYYANGGN